MATDSPQGFSDLLNQFSKLGLLDEVTIMSFPSWVRFSWVVSYLSMFDAFFQNEFLSKILKCRKDSLSNAVLARCSESTKPEKVISALEWF